MSEEIIIKRSWFTKLVELTENPTKGMKKLSPEELEILNRLEIPRLLGYCESARAIVKPVEGAQA